MTTSYNKQMSSNHKIGNNVGIRVGRLVLELYCVRWWARARNESGFILIIGDGCGRSEGGWILIIGDGCGRIEGGWIL